MIVFARARLVGPLGRIESGDGIVEGRDVASVAESYRVRTG